MHPDPPENCHLTVQKIAKNVTLLAIFLKKMKIFGNFFWKSVKFLPIFWQSNGNFPEGQVTRCHHNPMMAVSSMSRRSHTQFSRVAVSMRRGRKRSVKWPTGMTSTWDCRCCQMDLEREIETCSNWWIYPSFVITKKSHFYYKTIHLFV